jgi:mannose-6-phosphate isomerase-like protein (cupin superfamily)
MAKRVAKFLAQQAADAPFVRKGLRSFFEYRDLGLAQATGGRYGGYVVRAVRSGNESTGTHTHAPDAQIIYILKGWLKAEYGGQGIVMLKAGACLHNPPGNAHNVFEFSDDLEFLEITAPAEYATVDVESVAHPVPLRAPRPEAKRAAPAQRRRKAASRTASKNGRKRSAAAR